MSNLSKKEQELQIGKLTTYLLPLYKKEFPIIFFGALEVDVQL